MMTSIITHWLTPHYTNNHRPKILHPAGLTVVVGLFLFIQTSLQLSKLMVVLPGGFVLGYASSISPSQVVEMTNLERTKAGLPPLLVAEKLNQAAVAKATHMFQYDYWAHIAPDGTSPWVFIKNAGYTYTVAGENLARDFGDTGSMVTAWMNSPTHKANIIHSKYSQMGVAVVNGKLQGTETTLVVQMFGNPANQIAKTTPKAVTTEVKPVKEVTPLEVAQVEIVPQVETAPEIKPALGTQDVKKISPLTITKVIASSIIILLVLVLTYDSMIVSKKNLPRRVGNNWAHIAFLGIILVIIMALTEGNVM